MFDFLRKRKWEILLVAVGCLIVITTVILLMIFVPDKSKAKIIRAESSQGELLFYSEDYSSNDSYISEFSTSSEEPLSSAIVSESPEVSAIMPTTPANNLKLEDKEITDSENPAGKIWVKFDNTGDLVNDNYNFLPTGKYERKMKYSVAAGGKFFVEYGYYSIEKKGEITLIPDGKQGVKYEYKIEGTAFFIRVSGAKDWDSPYLLQE